MEYFPGFTTLQFVDKVQEFMNKMSDPAQFQVRIIFMSMFNDIRWGSTTFVSLFAKRFPAGRWSFLGPGSEKKWYSVYIDGPRGEWDRVAELMMIKIRRKRTPSFPNHESSVPRNAQKHRRWKIIDTLLC